MIERNREVPLPVTQTHSGVHAKGTILGLEGKTIIPVILSAVVSVLLMILLLMGANKGIVVRLLVSLTPVIVTLVYVVLLVHRKPPHYARDVFEKWRVHLPVVGGWISPHGLAFNPGGAGRALKNPYLRSAD